MKFLQRLLAKPKPKQILTDRLFGPGTFKIDVASLSTRSLDVFWKATSNEWRPTDKDRVYYQLQTDATLVSDDQNPLPHAVRVEIAGKVVGNLGNSDALRLYRGLNDLGYDQISSICKANIVGRIGYWKVNLDLDLGLSGTRAAPSSAGS